MLQQRYVTMLLVLMLLVTSCQQIPTPIPVPTSTPLPTPTPTPGIGSVVSSDIWQIKIVSVKKESTLNVARPHPSEIFGALMGRASLVIETYPSGFLGTATEGSSFLIIELGRCNVSADFQSFSTNHVTVTDGRTRAFRALGFKFWPPSTTAGYLLGTWNFKNIPSHGKDCPLKDEIAFQVPDDAKGFMLKFQDLPPIDLGQ